DAEPERKPGRNNDTGGAAISEKKPTDKDRTNQGPKVAAHGSNTDRKKPPDPGPRPKVIRQHPKGWELRQDFAIHVEMVEKPLKEDEEPKVKTPDRDGKYHLIDGEKLHLRVRLPTDAYVGVWYVDAEKNVVQLFPNNRDK